MTKPTIITCAVTGSAPTRKQNPAIPVTPEEIAQAAIEAAKAGAAIAHIHVRDPDTGQPSYELKHYRAVVDLIRRSDQDLIINLTGGPGARFDIGLDDPKIAGPKTTLKRPEARVEHIVELRPEMCSLDFHTLCSRGTVAINTPEHVTVMAEMMRDAGVKPELEVFDSGNIVLARELLDKGLFKAPPLFQMVIGVGYGAPGTPAALQFLRSLLPPDCEWSAVGIGRMQFPVAALSMLSGGHVRVGLEDNIYLEKGRLAPSNTALVEKAVRIIRDLGGAVATVAEARDILGLAAV
jgi:uncharacterized protein (DUF849 family)